VRQLDPVVVAKYFPGQHVPGQNLPGQNLAGQVRVGPPVAALGQGAVRPANTLH
jgi:hypothetical protein